jgi:hypothetical protein
MLLMKGWLETRWRLAAAFTYLSICLAINCQSRNSPAANPGRVLVPLGIILAFGSLTFAGSGVKSQAPAGFPEGLAGSTQFTISLPVSRQRLLAVRAAIGMLEAVALAIFIGCLAWGLFPSVRASVTQADFVRLVLTVILFLTAPYCTAVFFVTILDEPLSMVVAGWTNMLLLWLLHRTAPAVDIVRAWGAESPLITHTLPWSQMATCAGLATIMFLAAVRMVQTREY